MFGNEFYIKLKKALFIKDGFFKLVFIKIKNFYSAEDTVKRIKRYVTDREKVFAKYILAKGIKSKLYIELFKVNNKTAKKFRNTLNQTLNRHLTVDIYHR